MRYEKPFEQLSPAGKAYRIKRDKDPDGVRAELKRKYHEDKNADPQAFRAKEAEKRRAKKAKDPVGYARRQREATARSRARHPEQAKIVKERYRKKHPESVKRESEQSKLKEYGLTVDGYGDMLSAQSGVCAICRRACRSGRKLAVDHCHVTGKVRALLCGGCNGALGLMGDDPTLLRKGAEYLEYHAHSDTMPVAA